MFSCQGQGTAAPMSFHMSSSAQQPLATGTSSRDPYGSNPLIPHPHKIKLLSHSDEVEGYWVVIVGQEVGIFFAGKCSYESIIYAN